MKFKKIKCDDCDLLFYGQTRTKYCYACYIKRMKDKQKKWKK